MRDRVDFFFWVGIGEIGLNYVSYTISSKENLVCALIVDIFSVRRDYMQRILRPSD